MYDTVIATWNDRLVTAAYGCHMEVVSRSGQILQLHAAQRSIVADLNAYHCQLSVVDVKPCPHPCAFERSQYLLCSQIFGIDQIVNAESIEESAVALFHKLIVVNARHCLFCSKVFSYGAGYDIGGFERGDSYEQIALRHSGFRKHSERSRRTAVGHQIVVGIDRRQFFGIASTRITSCSSFDRSLARCDPTSPAPAITIFIS